MIALAAVVRQIATGGDALAPRRLDDFEDVSG